MIMAGGTGGHVFPALAVAHDLLQRDHQVSWMGTQYGLEARVVPQNNIPIDWLSVSGFRGKSGLKKVLAPLFLIRACWQALRILQRKKPDVVLGMGGFVSGPGGLVAWLMRIPLIIHEQNKIPGTTNRILGHLADKVLEAFPNSFKPSVGAVCTGNPVRQEIIAAHRQYAESINRPLRILIIGGSQGAQVLNEIVPKALADLDLDIEVYHQTGAAMQQQTVGVYAELNINARVEAFIERMSDAYQWADCVICRSGAMTVSELTVVGLPAVLVPFPHAIDDHQTHNANYLVESGAAVLIPQVDFNASVLASTLRTMLSENEKLTAMSKAAQQLAKPDAARIVADIALREVAV